MPEHREESASRVSSGGPTNADLCAKAASLHRGGGGCVWGAAGQAGWQAQGLPPLLARRFERARSSPLIFIHRPRSCSFRRSCSRLRQLNVAQAPKESDFPPSAGGGENASCTVGRGALFSRLFFFFFFDEERVSALLNHYAWMFCHVGEGAMERESDGDCTHVILAASLLG